MLLWNTIFYNQIRNSCYICTPCYSNLPQLSNVDQSFYHLKPQKKHLYHFERQKL